MFDAKKTRNPGRGRTRKIIRVHDCRREGITTKIFQGGGWDFNDFLRFLRGEFALHPNEAFVLVNTDRAVMDFDKFAELQDDCTLYLLQREDQALPVATEEHIKFQPHYDTLLRSGMYEYYASEGQMSLPYALAELIDNSLSATAKNTDVRTIEIRMLFDETQGKPAVICLDNGCGMTSKKLRNWAVYRHSKFFTDHDECTSNQEGYVRPDRVNYSLNSDISYFGVGGKQAVFYIGDTVRMITKAAGSPDVHELILSKENFERKQRDGEDVYSGVITNRKPGDSSHVNNKEELFLHELIRGETGKAGFTAVVITGVLPEHICQLKEGFSFWTRQLAHIYHYYIHGAKGNDLRSSSPSSDHRPKIDLLITFPPRCPHVLREVKDDMQTLLINSAADKFEFQAEAEDGGTVEGVVRYHPFLYDKETYPEEPSTMQGYTETDTGSPDDQDDSNEPAVLHQARGKRPIFECFWNGRLIPHTKITEFDWCKWPGKGAQVPIECYNRISGVLFADDKFQVTTNKLTFIDLPHKLKERKTKFTYRVKSKNRRCDIHAVFTQWLLQCHEKFDKEVKFLKPINTITRTDVTQKKKQHPWTTFSAIELDGKTYKTGRQLKSQKTNPIVYGTVAHFLLYGHHEGDVFATGGQVELILEPRAIYDQTKIIPISKIDRTASGEAIKTTINNNLAKFPHKLNVQWPEGFTWPQDAAYPAGTPLGPLGVEILNQKGESMSQIPALRPLPAKRLAVVLTLVRHGPEGDEKMLHCVGQYSSKWGFGFKKIDNLTTLGEYTLSLDTEIIESAARVSGGRELPRNGYKFSIKEGLAASFLVGAMSSTLRVGVPFDIPLQIKDGYDNSATPPANLTPVLVCSGLDLTHEAVDYSGTMFTIRGVKVRGKVNYQRSKTYDLKVTLPGLKKDSRSFKFSLLPGEAHSLHVTPQDDPVIIENGNHVRLNAEVHDVAGNITAHPRQIVHCQVHSFPVVRVDCSVTGAGQLVTDAINVEIINGEPQMLRLEISMPRQKDVLRVERQLKVVPSSKVVRMQVCIQDDESLVLRNNKKIEWLAGGLLGNLFYRLYDEAGRKVPLTGEIASMIKVNWKRDVNPGHLLQGRLPDIQVSTQVLEERFYQVSYQDQSVSASFTIKPCAEEPERLKATLSQSAVKLGETLPGNIILELMDQYDNATKTLTPACASCMTLDAEGLEKSSVAFTWQESSCSVTVTGIKFISGPLGPREMCFTYRTFVERVIVKVTAGVPAMLKLISGPPQPLELRNNRGIPTPFLIQLCDKWGNPSSDKRVVVQLRSSPQTLKVTKSVTSQAVDAEGMAAFTVNAVSGPVGRYQLEFKGSINDKPIKGLSLTLIVIPDPNKPVSLTVKYNTSGGFCAGGTFPVFSLTVVSEEGGPITTIKPAEVSMYVWKAAPSANHPPDMTPEMKPVGKDKNGSFIFSGKAIPEQAGEHTIQFSLSTDTTRILGEQIGINVVANKPVRLGPDAQPPTPVVSNGRDAASRTLVQNMTLRIMDSYGNPAGHILWGKVVVSIKASNGDGNSPLPLLEGATPTTKMELELSGGKVHVNRLAIMADSPGDNGGSYILLFQPEIPGLPLAAFELPFHFYNDTVSQLKMLDLSKKKDQLVEETAQLKDYISDSNQLLSIAKDDLQDATVRVTILKNELIKRNVSVTQTPTIPRIKKLLEAKTIESNRILSLPRRVCSIPDRFKEQQDVLGTVGHLASVRDSDAARVISWHIAGDMDCVITKTTAAAKRIYDITGGEQEVMALDSVYVAQGHRPLPHLRDVVAPFAAPGNPVFARELLIYPHDQASCDKLFRNILGDTILMDDLDSANSYRRAVVQSNMPCPTILTRQGDRISAKGKFGGARNKAPPINKLRVFGAPPPQEYNTLKSQIDLLSQLQVALEKRERADAEIGECEPKMTARKQELAERQSQLKEIERQLASTSVPGGKRGPEDAGGPSGIRTKRCKNED